LLQAVDDQIPCALAKAIAQRPLIFKVRQDAFVVRQPRLIYKVTDNSRCR
jgi:hypothetical protein